MYNSQNNRKERSFLDSIMISTINSNKKNEKEIKVYLIDTCSINKGLIFTPKT